MIDFYVVFDLDYYLTGGWPMWQREKYICTKENKTQN